MKEYVVYLIDPVETIILLALDIEEAKEIAFELYDHKRVMRIVLYIPINEEAKL
jgi:hypothetical protein